LTLPSGRTTSPILQSGNGTIGTSAFSPYVDGGVLIVVCGGFILASRVIQTRNMMRGCKRKEKRKNKEGSFNQIFIRDKRSRFGMMGACFFKI